MTYYNCKFQRFKRQVTYDGVNWFDTEEYKKGDLIEYQSTDCPLTP